MISTLQVISKEVMATARTTRSSAIGPGEKTAPYPERSGRKEDHVDARRPMTTRWPIIAVNGLGCVNPAKCPKRTISREPGSEYVAPVGSFACRRGSAPSSRLRRGQLQTPAIELDRKRCSNSTRPVPTAFRQNHMHQRNTVTFRVVCNPRRLFVIG